MELITVASFPDVKRPKHYSTSFFETEAKMSGVMPPPLHSIAACIGTT